MTAANAPSTGVPVSFEFFPPKTPERAEKLQRVTRNATTRAGDSEIKRDPHLRPPCSVRRGATAAERSREHR